MGLRVCVGVDEGRAVQEGVAEGLGERLRVAKALALAVGDKLRISVGLPVEERDAVGESEAPGNRVVLRELVEVGEGPEGVSLMEAVGVWVGEDVVLPRGVGVALTLRVREGVQV